jgi:hypothetical protein
MPLSMLAAVCTESKLYWSSSHCHLGEGMDYYIHLNYDSQDSLEKWWWELCRLGGPRIQSCRGTCLLSWLALRSHPCMLVVANLVERGETSFQAEWNSVCKLDSKCVDHQFWWTWASTSLLDNILPSCNTWQAKTWWQE